MTRTAPAAAARCPNLCLCNPADIQHQCWRPAGHDGDCTCRPGAYGVPAVSGTLLGLTPPTPEEPR